MDVEYIISVTTREDIIVVFIVTILGGFCNIMVHGFSLWAGA